MIIEVDKNDIPDIAKEQLLRNSKIVETLNPLPDPIIVLLILLAFLTGLVVGGMLTYGYVIGG